MTKKSALPSLDDPAVTETPSLAPRDTKAIQILATIRAGGATLESLMECYGMKREGIYGQISILNTRGLNIAEIDPSKAEFPWKGEDGVYTLIDYAAFCQSKAPKGTPAKVKLVHTPESMLARAQTRYDLGVKRAANAADAAIKAPESEIFRLKASITAMQEQLFAAQLAAVQSGDYQYERGDVTE